MIRAIIYEGQRVSYRGKDYDIEHVVGSTVSTVVGSWDGGDQSRQLSSSVVLKSCLNNRLYEVSLFDFCPEELIVLKSPFNEARCRFVKGQYIVDNSNPDVDRYRRKIAEVVLGRGCIIETKQDGSQRKLHSAKDHYVIEYHNSIGQFGLISIDSQNSYYFAKNQGTSVNNEPISVQNNQGEEKMSNVPALVSNVVDKNKNALEHAALLEAGALANKLVANLIRGYMPEGSGALLDTPLGHVLVANLLSLAVDKFAKDNALLVGASQAAIVAGYQEQLKVLDVTGLVEKLTATLTSDKKLVSLLTASQPT